ncbi:MAG TPA: HNH endonuclease [Pseudoxanthomonas sp.]
MGGVRWIPEEDEALRLAYGKLPTAEIAGLLKRSESSVGQRAKKLKLDHGSRFTEAEREELVRRFPHEPTRDIARDMRRTEPSISAFAKRLGLYKTEAYMAGEYKTVMRQLAMRNEGFIATRIRPGAVPPNKGKRMPGFAPGNMAATQFKKGRPAHEAANYVPIGTEKVDRKRNVLMRKVTDDPTIFPVKRWAPVHRLVWEAAHGPVPAGHFVCFKPGMKTLVAAEITLDRLELATNSSHMKRYSYHNNYPKEVGEAIRAKAYLTRAINRATRGERNV